MQETPHNFGPEKNNALPGLMFGDPKGMDIQRDYICLPEN